MTRLSVDVDVRVQNYTGMCCFATTVMFNFPVVPFEVSPTIWP